MGGKCCSEHIVMLRRGLTTKQHSVRRSLEDTGVCRKECRPQICLEFAAVILAVSPSGAVMKINLFLSSESCRFAAFSSTANALVAGHRYYE